MKQSPPFITVDADTHKRVVLQRTNSLEVAFARGEKYVSKNPPDNQTLRDYVVLDCNLKPVPKPDWMI